MALEGQVGGLDLRRLDLNHVELAGVVTEHDLRGVGVRRVDVYPDLEDVRPPIVGHRHVAILGHAVWIRLAAAQEDARRGTCRGIRRVLIRGRRHLPRRQRQAFHGPEQFLAAEPWIDRDHVVAAFGEVLEREVARSVVLRRRADHRDGLHGVEDAADVAVVVLVVAHDAEASYGGRTGKGPATQTTRRVNASGC